jgi:phospholipid/cholesterol/gamma-HCH transport system substrate-binding protein
VAHDLSPTLHSVRELSPNLLHLFRKLGPFEEASKKGFPALQSTLNGLAPVLDKLDPFLAQLNPVIRYLEFNRKVVTDFLGGPAFGLSGQYNGFPGDPAPRHGLRQLGYTGAESLSIWPTRLPTNRGNGYLAPGDLNSPASAANGIFPNFDCKNTDYGMGAPPSAQDTDEQQIVNGQTVPDLNGGHPPGTTPTQYPPCFVRHTFPGGFGTDRGPELFADP